MRMEAESWSSWPLRIDLCVEEGRIYENDVHMMCSLPVVLDLYAHDMLIIYLHSPDAHDDAEDEDDGRVCAAS